LRQAVESGNVDDVVAALEAIKAIVTTDDDRQITAIDLSRLFEYVHINFTDADVDQLGLLRGKRKLDRIESLDLTFSRALTDKSCRTIGQLPSLKSLSLQRVPITDAGLASLVSLKELETLDLGFTQVTSSGMKHLSRSRRINFLFLTREWPTWQVCRS